MKILKIRFGNINSLRGLHEIDFTAKPLSSSGLFAITGPTGSGKSTILDVITLALFNRIPRISEKISKGIIEKTGLILTRNMKDCFAEIRYESKAGIFTSRWSIQKARTGSLKDYEMEIADSDGNLFPVRKTEVPEKNEELIGLNFDQFVKAIVLAQGDFAAFLRAKGGEREKLLEQVTGSWIYREIGKAAYSKNKELGQELQLLADREAQLKSVMLGEEGYKELTQKLEQCNRDIAALNDSIIKLNAEKKLKEDIQNLIAATDAQEKNEYGIKVRQKEFLDRNGARLEKHRKLIPVQERLWRWQQLEEQIAASTKRQEGIKDEIRNCENEKKAIAAAVKSLTGSDGDIATALADFERKVLEIENQKAEKDTMVAGRREVLSKAASELSMDLDFTDTDLARRNIESAVSGNEKEISSLTEKLGKEIAAQPEDELKSLKSLISEAHSYKTKMALHEEKLKLLLKENAIAENYMKEIEGLPGLIERAKEQKKTYQLVYDTLEKDGRIRDLAARLEDHRKKLKNGEPCPLCGSTEHPYAEGMPHFPDDLGESIKKAKDENEKCGKEVTKLENSLVLKEEELKNKRAGIAGLNAEVASLHDSCRLILDKIPEKYRVLAPQEIIDKIGGEITDLESLVSASFRRKKLDQMKTGTEELAELIKKSSGLAAKRKEIFSGENVRKETSGYLGRHSAGISLSAKLQKEEEDISDKLKTDKEDLIGEEKTLLKELKDYRNIKDAFENLISGDEYQKLDADDNRFREDLKTAAAVLNENRRNLENLKTKDTKREKAETDAELESVKNTLAEKNLARDAMVTAKTVHDEASGKLERISADILDQKKRNEKWMLLDRYIGDADGKKFSVFAQQLTLFQLIKLANRRMDILSDRYSLDIPGEGEDDSLAVIDRHMGDMRRSVKSLSGGESFLVSLSLALALSDLASRQVEIKSLFIDEGFGSLDKVTLDQTIDTLERLQNETSKTIGVISHIEAMQERITTQIKLTRNGQGYSSVDIIG